ncbi:hypothetical protein [Actinosynnema sp. NPDC020468]|uniref:hypothetical protein n=1 Tax=Actinosynnema sp. NPDC020468 TaxID=3154488 RepID=UPI0033F6718F
MRFWVVVRATAAVVAGIFVLGWGRQPLVAACVTALGLVVLPFEVYLVRARRDWYLWASATALVVPGLVVLNQVITMSFADMGRERLLGTVALFAEGCYFLWGPLVVLGAAGVRFARVRRPEPPHLASTFVLLTLLWLGAGVVESVHGDPTASRCDLTWAVLVAVAGAGVSLRQRVLTLRAGEEPRPPAAEPWRTTPSG